MSLIELKSLLEAIQGFSNKVVYYAWPENEAPTLPFICYLERSSNNFAADGKVYESIKRIDIELYSRFKDIASETKVETALNGAGIFWNKTEEYISSEKVFMITYEIEV